MSIQPKNFEKEIGITEFFLKKGSIGGMIKEKPEDFIVIELDPEGQPVSQKDYFITKQPKPGLFSHFVLKKRLIDTPSAVNLLSKVLKIPVSNIGYAGLKDALAITYQRISTWGVDIQALRETRLQNMEIINPVPASYRLRLGQLSGNQFQIRITQLRENVQGSTIQNIISDLLNQGFPNYFGLQRFGSKRPVLHRVGKQIIKGNYENAVFTYLSTISSAEHISISSVREEFLRTGKYDVFLKDLPKHYTIERKMAQHLIRSPNDFQGALLGLPKRIKLLCISSYQSYLFNKTLSQLKNYISSNLNLDLPILGFETKIQNFPKNVQEILYKVLEKEEMVINNFKNPKKEISTRGGKRKAIIIPKELTWARESEKNLTLNFKLPRGSYATVLLRELIGDSKPASI